MNIRDLRYFVALAEEGHFGKAADACFVSQPTLSTQVKKLEDELGVQLIERMPRRAVVTRTGKQVLERARAILREVDEIQTFAKKAQNPDARSIRLGAFPTLAPYLFPRVLPSLQKRFPKLELLLVEDKTDNLLEQLRNGDLDAALLALPVDGDDLERRDLFEEPFVLAVPADHHLAKRSQISLDELEDAPLLLLEEGHCLRDQALEVCRMASTRERTDFRATSLETLRYMVAGHAGLTLLPLLATSPQDAERGIALVRFEEPVPSRKVALFWRKSSVQQHFLLKIAYELVPPQGLQKARPRSPHTPVES